MKFVLNASEFNAVMSCADISADTHAGYGLNTFFVDTEFLRLVASNGAVMGETDLMKYGHLDNTRLSAPVGGAQGFVFRALTKPILRSAETVVIDPKNQRLELLGNRYKGPKFIALEEVGGEFPKYRVASARGLPEGSGLPAVAFNPEYLYRPVKWAYLSSSCIRLTPGKTARDAMRFEIKGLDTVFTLMPCRW